MRCNWDSHHEPAINRLRLNAFEHGDAEVQRSDERYEKRNLGVSIVEKIMLL
jgi:hypothetical protein